jgi:hypothetical protein
MFALDSVECILDGRLDPARLIGGPQGTSPATRTSTTRPARAELLADLAVLLDHHSALMAAREDRLDAGELERSGAAVPARDPR